MYKQVYIFFILYLTLFAGAKVHAQDLEQVEAWDRSDVDYRPASAEKMEEYKQMDEYLYDRYKKPESVWDKIKRWLLKQILKSGVSGEFFMYVLIGIAVLILLIVILKLLGVKITGLFIFTHDNKVTNLNFKGGDDDIYNDKLESTLVVAINNKAYREAVRIMYLLTLRHLDSADLIDWKPWKTNREYYYELSSGELKDGFKNLIYDYEYVWYGQFYVEEDSFTRIRAEFNRFEQQLPHRKISA